MIDGLSLHGRLLAHASSYPFSTLLPAAPTSLILHRGVLTPATQRLATAFETDPRLLAAGASLDALRQIRDRAWFDDLPSGGPLHDILFTLARRHLRRTGSHVGLNPHPNHAERAREWRNLTYLLPADLLIAALCTAEHTEPRTETVDLLTPQLAAHLCDGVAETHLHLGASVPFPYLWASLTRDLASAPPSLADLAKGQPTLLGDAATLRARLVVAALARVLLAAFLLRIEHTGLPGDFTAFAGDPLLSIASRLHWPSGDDDAHRLLRGALTHLRRLDTTADVPRLLSLYRHLIGRPPVSRVATLADVAARDPLAAAFPASSARALPETRFLAGALRYLSTSGHADALFANLFWPYVRIRTSLYQHLTEAPQTAGLDWFALHYERISALRRGLDPVLADGALRHAARGLRLVSLEGRTAPASSWVGIRDEVRNLARLADAFNDARPATERTEVGLVLHFIKRATWKAADGPRHEMDPLGTGFRCGKWSTERGKEALAIETALDHHPELLLHLRGIDVANRELAIPAFCLVPLFDRVRRASERASARLTDVPPLRATAHAGEDFRRLLQGVRRIHELIEFDLLRTGDRIGHGLALGLDPKRWAEGAKIAIQPREERLDDLVWLLDRFGHGDVCVSGSMIERTRVEALALARVIYAGRFDTDNLVHARRLRHLPPALARLGFPFFPRGSPPAGIPPAEQLLVDYLTSGGVFERGQQPIEVLADDVDVELTRAAQTFVRREIVRLEITIETNPSSNLSVGDLGDVAEHPLFKMAPLVPSAAEPALLLSVNTDDPLTFATSLADEFAHLRFALERKGVDGTLALDFLERVRAQALRARFTRPASAESGTRDSLRQPRPGPGQPPVRTTPGARLSARTWSAIRGASRSSTSIAASASIPPSSSAR